jgi:hypothetical protein
LLEKAIKHPMKDYFLLLVLPSKTFDNIDAKKLNDSKLYLMWTILAGLLILPKFLSGTINSPQGLIVFFGFIIVVPLLYFPVIYGHGYLLWIFVKGFKGVATYKEIRSILVYSYFPFFLFAIVSLPFIITGVIKKDAEIVLHTNRITELIFWFLSFRILMVGIARYNKFNWIITLMVYLLSTSVIWGLAYFLIQLKH